MTLCACGCGGTTTSRFQRGHNARRAEVRHLEEDRGYSTPCWIWQLALLRSGYGHVNVKGHVQVAHKLYWEEINGPVPEGLELDHLCRVRACCNPAHLEAVTRAVNVQRGAAAKLTVDQVREIRASSEPPSVLADRYDVTAWTIWATRSGRKWKNVA